MKRFVKEDMAIQLVGIDAYIEHLSRIEVAFSQDKNSPALKIAVWLPGDTEEASLENDILLIPWTREETAKFRTDKAFWIDIRPTLDNGFDLRIDPFTEEMVWSSLGVYNHD